MLKQCRDASPSWNTSILILSWVLQFSFLSTFNALLCTELSRSGSNDEDDTFRSMTYTIIRLASSTACLLLTLLSMVLFRSCNVKPVIFLLINAISSAIWTILSIMDMVSIASHQVKVSNLLLLAGCILELLILFSIYTLLAYSALVYRRSYLAQAYSAVVDPHSIPSSEYLPSYEAVLAPVTLNPISPRALDVVTPVSSDLPTQSLTFTRVRDTQFDTWKIEHQWKGWRLSGSGEMWFGKGEAGKMQALLGENKPTYLERGLSSVSVPIVTVEDYDERNVVS